MPYSCVKLNAEKKIQIYVHVKTAKFTLCLSFNLCFQFACNYCLIFKGRSKETN